MLMMATGNRHREEAFTFTNPSSSSSPILASDKLDSYFGDPSSLIRSTSGCFQNEVLPGDAAETDSINNDAKFGFSRPGFRQSPLVGTVQFYQRHVFLCYKNPQAWPARIEASEFDRLPRLLNVAVMARKNDMVKQTHLTICEGHDGTETSNGDVLIFPDMIRYRRLTHFDVETFVEEALVKNVVWLPGTPETLKGAYVFVCSHGSRDRRCGVCGPVLVSRFREEIESHGLRGKVFVSPCSHTGHEYAGNVIIFKRNVKGEVTGHWYGYVAPDDVSILLHRHIIKGEIYDPLWRGQMGLSEDEQRKNQEQRLRPNGIRNIEDSADVLMQMNNHETRNVLYRSQDNFSDCCEANGLRCCQENRDSLCCQNDAVLERSKADAIEAEAKLPAKSKRNRRALSRVSSVKGSFRKFRSMPTWLDSWEQEDTYAALAVVCAAVSVVIAYSCYKQLR